MSSRLLRLLPYYLVNGLVGLLLAVYTYVLFFAAPYSGFKLDSPVGTISEVYQPGGLQPGDQLIRVGDFSIATFIANQREGFLSQYHAGEHVPLTIQRGAQTLTIDWTLPAYNGDEFLSRLESQWFLAWAFWLFGLLTAIAVRPRDTRWRLLIAFNYCLAIILSTSSVGPWRYGDSAIFLRMATWMSVPILWHLHWIFPTPFKKSPGAFWQALYIGASGLAILEWFQRLPSRLYLVGLLIALASIPALLLTRLLIPRYRAEVRLIAGVALIALLPSLVVGVISILAPAAIVGANFAGLPFWPVLPLAYFYSAYKKQLGGLEWRTNRIISAYLYTIILMLAFGLVVPAALTGLTLPNAPVLVALGAGLAGIVAGALGFRPFQRLVERFLLDIPLPNSNLTETYAARLTLSPDQGSLVYLLRDEILASLLVREAALVRLDETGAPTPVFALQATDLPSAADLPALLAQAGHFRPAAAQPLAWARVVLPLQIAGQPIGLLLLGRRDPDDYYSSSRIAQLRLLADQTAIALAHIQQTERLRQLIQVNINRSEREHAQLALELHDDVLNELALLAPGAAEQQADPGEAARYQRVVQRIRQTISSLRPTMLDYGLSNALEQLGDDLLERLGDKVELVVEVGGDPSRYAPDVEQHLFRIAQQAVENAVKHSGARRLWLRGIFHAEQAAISVEDDGRGLAPEALGDLAVLIAHQHFGLAGMRERAAAIGATLHLHSAPQRGTRVEVVWQAEAGAAGLALS